MNTEGLMFKHTIVKATFLIRYSTLIVSYVPEQMNREIKRIGKKKILRQSQVLRDSLDKIYRLNLEKTKPMFKTLEIKNTTFVIFEYFNKTQILSTENSNDLVYNFYNFNTISINIFLN